MFTYNKCLVKSCPNMAFSKVLPSPTSPTSSKEAINETIIENNSSYCLSHSSNPKKAMQDISQYIRTHEKIEHLNVSGMTFYNIDVSDKFFYGCTFMHCTFVDFHAYQCHFYLCITDFSVFTGSSFLNCNIQSCSFAGTKLSHCIFSNGELTQNNFNGVSCYQSSFDNSDLYNSRFILSRLENVSFRNCNLKKANFSHIARNNVSFEISNTREAIFDSEDIRADIEAKK